MTELAVVLPVFNEQERVVGTVERWARVLDAALPGRHVLLVFDDGSTDATAERLAAAALRLPAVRLFRHANRGHGPTLMRAYVEAVAEAEWVFQADGDSEVAPESFPRLWALRDGCGAVFGLRDMRDRPAARRLCSALARLAARALFGPTPRDVNVPFRLVRASVLAAALTGLPGDCRVPNILLSGRIVRAGIPWRETAADYAPRPPAGRLRRGRLLRFTAAAALQSLVILLRAPRPRGAPRDRDPPT